MAHKEILLPKMGESIAEATIIRWLKSEGEHVELDEPIVEIATDKVDSEVPSPFEGTLTKILHQEGDVVAVGAPLCHIGAEGAESVANATPIAVAEPAKEVIAEITKPLADKGPIEAISQGSGSRFYSPLVLNIARAESISMATLESITGTGKEGRVTKRDILAFISNPSEVATNNTSANSPAAVEQKVTETITPAPSAPKAPAVSINQGDEIIEMDRMRKLIADHMVMSKQTSPHVTSFVEVDVTNLVMWREKVKNSLQKREGQKLTFTPIFIEAVVKAIKDFPMINISVNKEGQIIKRKTSILAWQQHCQVET